MICEHSIAKAVSLIQTNWSQLVIQAISNDHQSICNLECVSVLARMRCLNSIYKLKNRKKNIWTHFQLVFLVHFKLHWIQIALVSVARNKRMFDLKIERTKMCWMHRILCNIQSLYCIRNQHRSESSNKI